jgi:hypothetical protein
MAAKRPTVRSNKFQRVGDVGLDARKRVSLAKAIAALNGSLVKKSRADQKTDLRFEIHLNDAGQILLSPHVVSPHEAWLYKNPKALASLRRGIAQAARGELHDLGSFAKYADDEID